MCENVQLRDCVQESHPDPYKEKIQQLQETIDRLIEKISKQEELHVQRTETINQLLAYAKEQADARVALMKKLEDMEQKMRHIGMSSIF